MVNTRDTTFITHSNQTNNLYACGTLYSRPYLFPRAFVDLQHQHWDPIVKWAEEYYDVKIELSVTDFRHLQLTEAKDKFRGIVNAFDGLKLSGNVMLVCHI